ncbi:MAG: hypothetical protein KJO35_10120 [Gammaproteobacteria bacterium]|nr:hypothetical protein [Gammaproteobacteria bacterium]NNF66748.1 hypothetical protein [Gammaproteobacteria bacterium]
MNNLLKNTNWGTYTGRLHMGIDTLAEPPILTLVDDHDYRVHQRRRLVGRPDEMISQMKAAGPVIADVIVLARRDGYTLVDKIAEAGFQVHLITPAELRRYSKARNVHDQHDAYWIAHLLRAGALPHGEIYWSGEIRDIHPHPRLPARTPSLISRLRLKKPAVELGGNLRYPYRSR